MTTQSSKKVVRIDGPKVIVRKRAATIPAKWNVTVSGKAGDSFTATITRTSGPAAPEEMKKNNFTLPKDEVASFSISLDVKGENPASGVPTPLADYEVRVEGKTYPFKVVEAETPTDFDAVKKDLSIEKFPIERVSRLGGAKVELIFDSGESVASTTSATLPGFTEGDVRIDDASAFVGPIPAVKGPGTDGGNAQFARMAGAFLMVVFRASGCKKFCRTQLLVEHRIEIVRGGATLVTANLDPAPILDQPPGKETCTDLNVDISESAEGVIAKGFLDVPVTSGIKSGFKYKFKNSETVLQTGDQVKETRLFRLFVFCKDTETKVLLFVVNWGYSTSVVVQADESASQYDSAPKPSPPTMKPGSEEPGANAEIAGAKGNGSTADNKPLGKGLGVSFPTLVSTP